MKRTLLPLLIIALTTLALVEAGARLAEVLVPPKILANEDIWWVVRDPYLGWRNRPGHLVQFHIDDDGHRVVAPARASDTTVLCLGDSGTFGVWQDGKAPHFDSYVDALAARTGYTVRNAGCVGYTTWHALRQMLLDNGSSDIVVVRLGWNDHITAHTIGLTAPDSAVAATLNRTAAGRLVLAALQPPPAAGRPFVPIEDFERNIRRMAEIARANGQTLLFVDYPIALTDANAALAVYFHHGQATDAAEVLAIHRRYQQVLAAICREEGLEFVRTEPTFCDADAVHPDAEGCERIAAAVADALHHS